MTLPYKDNAMASRILEAYGLRSAHIHAPIGGYRNRTYRFSTLDGQQLNLICYKRESGILDKVRRADTVSGYAHKAGLPVRFRHDTRILRLGVDSFAGVYNYLPGSTIPWEDYTKKHLKLLGWLMADLHTSISDLGPVDEHNFYEEWSAQIDRMESYFYKQSVAAAVRSKLGIQPIESEVLSNFRKLIAHCSKHPTQQYIHLDMVRGNVIFDTAKKGDKWQIDGIALTGLIDFEKTAYAHPMLDVARTLAFLLVDCPRPSSEIISYYLNSGYIKRGKRQLVDKELISPLVRMFLFHDFYKFLLHTPYESLQDNHHYCRTKSLLMDYGMINTVK